MSEAFEMAPHREAPIVVQKYGGTSVGDPERIRRVAQRIAREYKRTSVRLAVVVSAMAGETNRLIELLRQVNPRYGSRSYDMAVAAGEQVSVGLLCAALEAEGLKAEPLLGYQAGILTDAFHGKARIQAIRCDRIEQSFRRGEIPVIAGFQGMTSDTALTTLGRGGSDTSAVALAVALKATCCEINTDVDGVFTADPRLVPGARLIPELDYDVALELAASGSKVLHSRCVELGAKYRTPILVRNTFAEDEARRTLLMALNQEALLESPVVSGVTLDREVAKVTLKGKGQGSPLISEVFSRVAARGINVDIIVYDRPEFPHELSVGFTVSCLELPATLEVLETLRSEFPSRELMVESLKGLSKVSAIGLGMRSHPGVASKVLVGLAGAGIDIQMISTSEIKISCVVTEEHGERAVRMLHAIFFEGQSLTPLH